MVINLDQDPFACEANATVANPSELKKKTISKINIIYLSHVFFFSTSFRRMPVRGGQHMGNNMA